MLTPFRPAVLACLRHQRPGEKPESDWPPPYRDWPELADPTTFYNLPTLLSLPTFGIALYSPDDPYWDWSELISTTDFLKQWYLYYEDRVTYPVLPNAVITEENPFSKRIAAASVQVLHDGETIFEKASADPEWDTFADFHDLGHWQSWSWVRSSTTKFNNLVSAVFDLLKPENVSQSADFWTEFEQRNMKVVEYLEKALVLEEMRASLIALSVYPAEIYAASIEADLRLDLMKRRMLNLFDGFIATKASWSSAVVLTLLAELSDPEDPIQGLSGLQNGLIELQSCNWSKDQWCTWLKERIDPYTIKSKMFQQTWELNLYGYKENLRGTLQPSGCTDTVTTKTKIPGTSSNFYHVAPAYPPVPYNIAEAVILESLRQQLAQPFGLGLVCPSKHKRGTCCGFGHYFRAIWEQVPLEYRYPKSVPDPQTGKKLFFRKPPKACLNYGLS